MLNGKHRLLQKLNAIRHERLVGILEIIISLREQAYLLGATLDV